MRVVNADQLLSAGARGVDGGEMILRVDEEPRRSRLEVARRMGALDAAAATEEQSAAFVRQRLSGVRDDRVERGW